MFRPWPTGRPFLLMSLVSYGVLMAGVGIAGTQLFNHLQNQNAQSNERLALYERRTMPNESYIQPLLDCSPIKGITDTAQVEYLKNRLQSYLRAKELPESEVSVYFQDLTSGAWFGIQENKKYHVGSLPKTNLMVVYLRLIELGYISLDQTIANDDQFTTTSTLHPYEKLKPSEKYSLESLIRRIIIYSDNDATFLLNNWLYSPENGVPSEVILKVNNEVNAAMVDHINQASPSEISRVYRLLYNSSYLNEEHSEFALSLLSQTQFDSGLRHHLPEETQVAHKYGIRQPISGQQYFHDCGIIYHPNNPYFLCIMSTHPQDIDHLYPIIQEVSRIVFEYMNEISQAE